MVKSLERILKAERAAIMGGIGELRNKIVTTLVANHPTVLRSTLMNFISEDLSKRIELAFSWLYEEYCFCHSFHKVLYFETVFFRPAHG
jgi:symplekin